MLDGSGEFAPGWLQAGDDDPALSISHGFAGACTPVLPATVNRPGCPTLYEGVDAGRPPAPLAANGADASDADGAKDVFRPGLPVGSVGTFVTPVGVATVEAVPGAVAIGAADCSC